MNAIQYFPATSHEPAFIVLPDEMPCAICERVIPSGDVDELNDGAREFVCAPCYRTATAPVDCGDCIAATQGRDAR